MEAIQPVRPPRRQPSPYPARLILNAEAANIRMMSRLEAAAPAAAGWSVSRLLRLNLALPLIAGALALVVFSFGDRTSWNAGYGYDGVTYGAIAQDFPGAVSGTAPVPNPGAGPDTASGRLGPPPKGVDGYYVKRIVPSALVWTTAKAVGLKPTPREVVRVFALWTVALVVVIALLWCLAADSLRLTAEQKMLGWMALILNYAALKASAYFPVTTDIFAYAEGTALLYFWTRRNSFGIAAVSLLGAFTWPTILWFGLALLVYPLDRRVLAPESARPRRLDRKNVIVAGAAAAAFLAILVYWRSIITKGGTFNTPPLHKIWSVAPYLLPLGILLATAFVFWTLRWLLPLWDRADLVRLARPLWGPRAAAGALIVVLVFVLQHVIARRSGYLTETGLVHESLPFSALFPGLFAVTVVGYFGPLVALGGLRWRSVTRALHAHGIGITLVALAFLGSVLLVEARKALPTYPLLVPFFVMALGDMRGRRFFLGAFAAVSLVASRFWLHIGHWPFDFRTLRDFPAERFHMATGIWTSWQMYLLQLGVGVAATLLLVRLLRSRSRPLAAGV
jgi:hypothetical protein